MPTKQVQSAQPIQATQATQSLELGSTSIAELWTHLRHRIPKIRNQTIRYKLEYMLSQRKLSHSKLEIMFAFVEYLVCRQSIEENIDVKLNTTCARFAKHVKHLVRDRAMTYM